MKKERKFRIPAITFYILALVLICCVDLVKDYQYVNIDSNKLIQVEEEFLYGMQHNRSTYRIECLDGDVYYIKRGLIDWDTISVKKGDELLLSLKGEKIVELTINGRQIVSLEDCRAEYKSEVKFDIIIICGIISLFIIFCVWATIYSNKGVKITKSASGESFGSDIDLQIYRKTKESMIKTNGGYYCDFLSLVNQGDATKGESVLKGVMDYICDDQFVLVFDRDEKNMAFAFYKKGEKLYFETLFKDKGQPFKISSTLFWFEPYNAQVTQDEQIAFSRALEYYLLTNGDLLEMM